MLKNILENKIRTENAFRSDEEMNQIIQNKVYNGLSEEEACFMVHYWFARHESE